MFYFRRLFGAAFMWPYNLQKVPSQNCRLHIPVHTSEHTVRARGCCDVVGGATKVSVVGPCLDLLLTYSPKVKRRASLFYENKPVGGGI